MPPLVFSYIFPELEFTHLAKFPQIASFRQIGSCQSLIHCFYQYFTGVYWNCRVSKNCSHCNDHYFTYGSTFSCLYWHIQYEKGIGSVVQLRSPSYFLKRLFPRSPSICFCWLSVKLTAGWYWTVIISFCWIEVENLQNIQERSSNIVVCLKFFSIFPQLGHIFRGS